MTLKFFRIDKIQDLRENFEIRFVDAWKNRSHNWGSDCYRNRYRRSLFMLLLLFIRDEKVVMMRSPCFYV